VYILCAQDIVNILFAQAIINILCVQDIFRACNWVFDLVMLVVLYECNLRILTSCLVLCVTFF
jgi:hypothetical protein